MLLFDPTIQTAAAKMACGERARFLIEACAEALDPAAHFDRIASARITPSAALGELLDAADGYQESATHGFAPLLDAIERAAQVCSSNELLRIHFWSATKTFLTHLSGVSAGIAGLGSNTAAKRAYLSPRIKALQSVAESLDETLSDDTSGYLEALVQETSTAVTSQNKLTVREARNLESIAMHLCSFLLTQGRSPVPTAKMIAKSLGAASSPSKAASATEEVLRAGKKNFRVAVVIDGVGVVIGAGNHGLTQLAKGRRISWGPDDKGIEHHAADTELARFSLRHWHAESVEEPLKNSTGSGSVFTLSTEAWDADSARRAALKVADSVVDLLNAEHRATSFGVKRKVLVWEVGRAACTYLAGRDAYVLRGRLMDITKSPSVSRSLRFATKASMERAGTLKVFFSWVALEYLARDGSEKPQNTVVEKVPKIIALVAVRQQVYRSWALYARSKAASQQVVNVVEAGKGRGAVDPSAWCGILTSSRSDLKGIDPDIVREYVRSLTGLTPYVAFRLKSTRDLLSNGDSLASFCVAIEELARFNMQRMRYVRNQTAHSAELEHAADSQLSVVALLALDATFECVPKWPGVPPVDALDRLHARYRNSLLHWRRAARSKTSPNARVEVLLLP